VACPSLNFYKGHERYKIERKRIFYSWVTFFICVLLWTIGAIGLNKIIPDNNPIITPIAFLKDIPNITCPLAIHSRFLDFWIFGQILLILIFFCICKKDILKIETENY
jgi:hypothetical protein